MKNAHEQITYDTIIIGGGVAGLSAAMYAGRLEMKTLLLADALGGAIVLTDVVENYPGFIRLTGQELADRIKEHAMQYPVRMVEEGATGAKKCSKSCYVVYTSSQSFHAKSIIFATGTRRRALGVPGEKEFEGKGVHTCALCDGPLYKGKIVAVVGGSDSAAKEALLLTQWAKKVYIINRGKKIRPEPINMTRVNAKVKEGRIEVINKTRVTGIKGGKFVDAAILDKPYKGRIELALDAVFVEIGSVPASELAKKLGVKTNEKSEIVINREAKTSVPGVFACGDVADTKFKQAITGVGEAVLAAYSAYTYVNENEFICACSDEP